MPLVVKITYRGGFVVWAQQKAGLHSIVVHCNMVNVDFVILNPSIVSRAGSVKNLDITFG